MTVGRGTPFDALFAALTERMGVLHSAAPDTDPSTRDRVEWVRDGDLAFEPSPYRPDGQKTVKRMLHPWAVTLYGATDLEVCDRVGEFVGHLDEIVGPEQGTSEVADHHGYIVRPGKPAFRGGDGISQGWACTCSVTLRTLALSQIWPPHAVATVTTTTTVTAADGTGGEALS